MRALTAVLLIVMPTICAAQYPLAYDFEQGEDLTAYEGLGLSNADAEVVAPGADGKGHCLRMSTPETSKYCTMTIRRPMPVVKNLVLSFDYRTGIGAGQEARYVGILFFYADGKQFGRWDHEFSDEWAHAELTLHSLRSSNDGALEVGREFNRLNLYGRSSDEGADMTVWLDNIRLEVAAPSSTLQGPARTSLSNPPLLNWPQGSGGSRLQYSRSPEFPDDATTTVDSPWNFHTPDAPLDAGEWYWRAYVDSALTEGWTDIRQVVIPDEAHRFVTEPIDEAAILARPRPWLIDVEAERARRDEAGLALLVKQAEADYARGIPDDPPIWEEGDERWPAWIDWYRDVHGRITSRVGRRLEIMAHRAAVSGDEQVYGWTREMALLVAAWDPAGGSAMRRGDIGAHHVLLGLTACYDALHDRLSDEDRETLQSAIIARVGDFWGYVNPLRGNPYNNHAWLKTLVVGQAGLVLLGDHDDAYQWAEFARQQFIGVYLCGLGYQGDNNEGLSYWSYGLGFIIRYADLLRTVTGLDLYQQPWLNQTARFPMYGAPPNAWGVSFADTGKPNHNVRGPYSTKYVGMLATRARDPYALWYSGSRESVDGLVSRPPVDLPQSLLYRFIGLGIVNDSLLDGREGVTFAMHSGRYFAGHQHADQNAFVIHAYGEKLAIDSGYYDWYGSPHFKQYSLQTVAHNSVLINGEGQAAVTAGADGRMAAWFDSPGYSYLVGDASAEPVYGGALSRFDRRVLMIRPGLIIVHDLLEAPEPAQWQWLLHTVAPIETDTRARKFSVTSGAARMTASFLSPNELDMTVTDRYPVHPYDGYGTVPIPEDRLAKEWHLSVAPTRAAAREQFLTVFDVRRSGNEGAAVVRSLVTKTGVGLLLADGPRRTAALLMDAGGERPLVAGDFVADADAAAVTVADGRVVGVFAHNAASVVRAGQTLFSLDEGAGSFALIVTAEGCLADLDLPEAAMVTLLCPSPPVAAALDDITTDVTRDSASRTLRLRVPAGRHTLSWGDDPASVGSHALDGAPLFIEGKVVKLEGYARRTGWGFLRNWWGQVTVASPRSHELKLTGLSGALPKVSWDGRGVELTAADHNTASAIVWAGAGVHHLTIGASGEMSGALLRGIGSAPAPTEMLPADWELPEGALTFEAEAPTAESSVKATRTKKVAASGGLGHVGWDTDGMWAEWTLAVPADGDYELLFRAASIYAGIHRELRLDGELLPVAGVSRFESTGGWCRTSNDWRWFRVAEPVRLSAGEHVLCMTRLEQSMNLDLIALIPR